MRGLSAGPRRGESITDYFSWPAIRLFAVLYVVGISNGVVQTLVLLGLLAWSFMGPTQAIMAMTMVAMYKFANAAVASFSPLANILFWLITVAASVQLYRSARGAGLPFMLLTAFAVVAAVLSAVVSKAPDVSLMKVASFFLTSSALLLAAPSLRPVEVAALQRWFFSVALVMAAFAVLTIPFPSIGFRKVAGSLQGMFGHPQTAGVFYAPFAAWLIVRIFLEPLGRLPRWLPWMAALFAGLIIASSARTAMLATFVGVAVALTVVLATGRTGPANRSRGQLLGFASVLGVLSMAIIFSGVLQDEVEAIILKGETDTGSVGEAFEHARGAGMKSHLENFRAAPLTGHGFGVYTFGVRERHVVRVFGIPISASAEKGIVFTAVLEETGILGGLLFYALLISIIAGVAKGASVGALAMVVACIAVNFGEAIFFATGGMGLFMWLLIGFCLARARLPADLSDTAAVKPTRRRFPKNLMR